jgi:hypothetical protein
MEGAALAAKRQSDLATATAWHTAMFALAGYSGGLKGKRLSDYLSPDETHLKKNAEAIAFFHKLKARGVPVDITRLN